MAGFLAGVLDEGGASIHRFRFGRDLAEEVGRANMDAAVAADVQFISAVDAHDTEILDRRLGAVSRAARHRDLELVRHPAAPSHPFDLAAEPGRILLSATAPFGLDAGLPGAKRLEIR